MIVEPITSTISQAAQHAHPADRFARETLAILKRDTSRSRRLMRNMLGGSKPVLTPILSKTYLPIA